MQERDIHFTNKKVVHPEAKIIGVLRGLYETGFECSRKRIANGGVVSLHNLAEQWDKVSCC